MITISKKVYEAILNHCYGSFPQEACGLLIGACTALRASDDRTIHINDWVASPNVSANPYETFFISPELHLATQKKLRHENLRELIIGAYHSHPHGSTLPSTTDVTHACDSQLPCWMIASIPSLRVADVKFFLVQQNKMTASEFQLTTY